MVDPDGLDALYAAANFAAGLGDHISFNLTRRYRQWLWGKDVVNPCSGWYAAGDYAGYGYDIVGGVGGAIRGGMRGAARGAGRLCNCFTGETLVHTEAGPMPISNIEPGQYVRAYDETTGEIAEGRVLTTLKRTVDGILLIHLADDVLGITREHPLYVEDRGWTEAQHIHVGDLLHTLSGELREVLRIEPKGGEFTVYNFAVANHHNYFVAEGQILVHNVCPVPPPAGGGIYSFMLTDGKKYIGSTKDFVRRAGEHLRGQWRDQIVPGSWNFNQMPGSTRLSRRIAEERAIITSGWDNLANQVHAVAPRFHRIYGIR